MNKIYNTIRNIVVGTLCVVAGLSITSCEDMLTEKPYNLYDADTYFSSVDLLEMATLGVYESMNELNNYGWAWMLYDCGTDINIIEGGYTGHQARDLTSYYNVKPTEVLFQNSWALYYRGIDRANMILANGIHTPVVGDDAVKAKKRFLAETRFLRGLYYFDLVRLFGDVPIRTNFSKGDENFNMVRSDRDLVYDRITEDMSTAIEDLPTSAELESVNTRLNKDAALGLLARVYLFRGGYSLRQDGIIKRPTNYQDYYRLAGECIKRIDKQQHALNPSFEEVFKNYCQGITEPKESMFELEFFNVSGQDPHSGWFGTYNGPKIADGSIYGRANSFVKTTITYYNSFAEGDLRRDATIATYTIDKNNGKKAISERLNHQYACRKWTRELQNFPIKNVNNTDANFCLLRYSDVLLMDAEIQNELSNGPTDEAVESINKVRRRGYGKPVDAPDATVDLVKTDFNKESFLAFIQDERARELGFELGRKQDLIRWNMLKAAIDRQSTQFEAWRADYIARVPKDKDRTYQGMFAPKYFETGKHELFPIPDYERRETGFSLTQNPKYN